MENIKGKKIDLCPKIKENCIFNTKEWKYRKPKECFNCKISKLKV